VPRPKNQTQRRAELVATTSRLLVDRGAAGARLTDIAEAAGLTPASVSYYYPNLIDLYAETTSTAVAEYVTARRAHVEAVDDAVPKLRECLRLGIPVQGEPSFDATVLLLEIAALSTRNQGFDESSDFFLDAELQLFEEVIQAGVDAGIYSPAHGTAHVARVLLAIEDGLSITIIRGALSPRAALDTILTAASTLVGHDVTLSAAEPNS